MNTATETFYRTGGSLYNNSRSYVERPADGQLYSLMTGGKFCYILDSRQVGKSSLMTRTAARLGLLGVQTAFVDLAKIGTNVTIEQWYFSQIERIARDLAMTRAGVQAWAQYRESLSPLQCWTHVIEDVFLPACPGQLAIFIDEIDSVQTIKTFSADEYFAAIRSMFVERTRNAQLERLVFCLAGVASPTDLIRDPRTTEFNIGQRIELYDFTRSEASVLQEGLGSDPATNEALLERVYYWTKGHPYLTQKLCERVAEASGAGVPPPPGQLVNEACRDLFLRPSAADDNLISVDKRIRESGNKNSLLHLYRKVRAGRRVHHDDTDRTEEELRLSGIVRVEEGVLRVRNPIYSAVFDRRWLRRNTSDAEIRRQRVAATKGAAAGALLLALLGAPFYVQQKRMHTLEDKQISAELRAQTEQKAKNLERELKDQAAQNADKEAQRAKQEAQHAQDGFASLFAAKADLLLFRESQRIGYSVMLAVDSLSRNPERGLSAAGPLVLAASWLPPLTRIWQTGGRVLAVAASAKGRYIASALDDGAVQVWHADSGMPAGTGVRHRAAACDVQFSPDGRFLASASQDGTAAIYDLATQTTTWLRHPGPVFHIRFSPAGNLLATACADGYCRLWDLHGAKTAEWQNYSDVTNVAFSPDGSLLATSTLEGIVFMRRMPEGHELWKRALGSAVIAMAFSADSDLLAVAGRSDPAIVYTAATGRQISRVEHGGTVNGIDFSPDDRYFATAGRDRWLELWEVSTGRHVARAHHDGPVLGVRFAPDGQHLLTWSAEETLHEWTVPGLLEAGRMIHHGEVHGMAFAGNNLLVSGGSDRSVRLWKYQNRAGAVRLAGDDRIDRMALTPDSRYLVAAGEQSDTPTRSSLHVYRLAGGTPSRSVGVFMQEGTVDKIAFSPDGNYLATSGDTSSAALWEVPTGARLANLTHQDTVYHVEFSPDGKLVATASKDELAALWNIRGARRRSFRHSGEVNWATFSPDEKLLATACDDRYVYLWRLDAPDTTPPVKLGPLKGQVLRVAFSPSHQNVLAASDDAGKLTVWRRQGDRFVADDAQDLGERIEELSFSPHGNYIGMIAGKRAGVLALRKGSKLKSLVRQQRINALRFSPNEDYFVIGGDLSAIELFDTARFQSIRSFATDPEVLSLAFSPDSDYVYAAEKDGATVTWNIWNPERPASVLPVSSSLRTLTLSNGGRYLAAGGDTPPQRGAQYRSLVWDLRTAQIATRYNGHSNKIYSVHTSADGGLVVTASADHTARIWNRATGMDVSVLRHPEEVNDAEFSPDAKRVLTACDDHFARLWSVPDGALVRKFQSTDDTEVNAASFRPGSNMAVIRSARSVQVWDLATGKSLRSMSLPNHEVITALAISPDGRYAGAAGRGPTAMVWNLAEPRTGPLAIHHGDQVNTIAFSADSRRVATGGNDETVRITDLVTGASIHMVTAGKVQSISFANQHDLLLAQSSDAVEVFKLAGGQALLERIFHTGGAAFADAGEEFVAATSDGSGWIIPLLPQRLQQLGCAIPIPALNPDRWGTYAANEPLSSTCGELSSHRRQ